MPRYEVVARFADAADADAARQALSADGLPSRVVPDTANLGERETRFMGRIVILIALWSVLGTALGAGFGVLVATVIGPHGTSGLIIEAVSWALFAHLLVGLWAGYWLLADRSREDLPIPGGGAVLLVVECASIDDTDRATARLRELGAADITSDVQANRR